MKNFYIRVTSSEKASVIISVSKKVSKKAVTRNTIKRRVRAVIRSILPKLKPAKYLIVANQGAENIRGKELENELKKLFVVSRSL